MQLLPFLCILSCQICSAGGTGDTISNNQLLPVETQALFEIFDAPRTEERWGRTHLGQLVDDPALKPFWDQQEDSIRKRISKSGIALNITLDDIWNIASGGALVAWAQLKSKTGVCVIAEVEGREGATDDVLSRIDKDLRTKRQATVEKQTYRGHEVSTYTLKRKIGQINVERFSYVRVDDRLIASDQFELVSKILDAVEDPASRGKLLETSDFTKVQQRSGDNSNADIGWFLRPLNYARIMETRGGGLKKQQLDTIKLLRDQGFDAILAAGGHLTLDDNQYDLSHQAFVLAPPTTNQESRYKLAARMLQFPNLPGQAPPDWVLPTVASYLDGNWKMEEAFWAAETLVNQAVGDEIFRRVVDGIKKDKDGPQIDIANDIIANLQDRLIMITDNVLPVTKQSERMLIAVSLKNVDVVKAAVDKAMKNDPNAIEFKYPHHKWIWQVTQPEIDDDLNLEGFEDFEEFDDFDDFGEGDEADDKPPLLDQWAITVYDGYLMFSSHAQMLVDTIEHHRNKRPSVANEPDYQRIVKALTERGGKSKAIWRVLRTKLAMHVKYELFRRGELKDSDSVLASLLRRILEDAEPQDEDDEGGIDGSKLPPFAAIEKHLNPSGIMVKTTNDGWLLNGVMLK